jgi:hypothetical protein
LKGRGIALPCLDRDLFEGNAVETVLGEQTLSRIDQPFLCVAARHRPTLINALH